MDLQSRISKLLQNPVDKIVEDSSLISELSSICISLGIDFNKKCQSCARAKIERLRKINVNKIHITMQKNRRYYLPEGKVYRPMGSGILYSNENLTDALVEKWIEKNPGVAQVFIDTESEEMKNKIDVASQLDDADPLKDVKKPQLIEIYKELTDKEPEGKPTVAQLKEMIREEQAALAKLGVAPDEEGEGEGEGEDKEE